MRPLGGGSATCLTVGFASVSIAAAIPVAGEGILGWGVHYATGIAYAALLVAMGRGWVSAPTLLPALAVGLVTILVPFLVMQPAFGLGIASSRHPRPWSARLRSLTNHLSFGLGLYLSAESFVWLQRGVASVPPHEAHPQEADRAEAEAHRRDLEVAVEVGDGIGADQRHRFRLACASVRCQSVRVRA